ncbi:hypothetical protein [Marinicrinis lubricantis]|uniref:Uncharacterized protein n=1 Tax=Marinicrinis lubricantis TaxID=2086470 RepID=A0ABW1IPQ0_9BACL
MTKEDGYYLEIRDQNGGTGQKHLLSYLAELTVDMLSVADQPSKVIYEEYCKRYGPIPLSYVALVGVCIPAFVQFLGLDDKLD